MDPLLQLKQRLRTQSMQAYFPSKPMKAPKQKLVISFGHLFTKNSKKVAKSKTILFQWGGLEALARSIQATGKSQRQRSHSRRLQGGGRRGWPRRPGYCTQTKLISLDMASSTFNTSQGMDCKSSRCRLILSPSTIGTINLPHQA